MSVGFYGGEPLLRMDLIEASVKHVRALAGKRRIGFHITTNGTLLDDFRADFLMKNDFRVMVSLDGPVDVHDRSRVRADGSGTHQIVLDHLTRLQKRYPKQFVGRVSLSVVFSVAVDFRRLYRFFDRPLLRNMPALVGRVDDPEGQYAKTYRVISETDRGYEWLKERYRNAVVSGKMPNGFLRGIFEGEMARLHQRGSGSLLPRTMHPNGICLPGVRRMYVDVDGRIHACEKINHNMPIGTIDRGFDTRAIAGAVARYCQMSLPDCSHCWAVRFCQMCFCNALRKTLSVHSKRRCCQSVQSHLLDMFGLYCSIVEANPAATRSWESLGFV